MTNAETALNAWLAPGTWDRSHPAEDERFYLFVASFWQENKAPWDEAEAREMIKAKAIECHRGFDPLAADVARRRVEEGTTILDFLEHIQGSYSLIPT